MHAFVLSFGVIFLAELGDKSQLMAMAFASRYRALTVLVAVTIATLIVHAGSVLIGSAFALALSTAAIQVAAGLSFFAFAVWTLRGDALGEDDESRAKRSGRWALLTIGTAFFLAELGDKTQLATISLASSYDWLPVALGALLGFAAVVALGVALGEVIARKVKRQYVVIGAAIFSIAMGAYFIVEALFL